MEKGPDPKSKKANQSFSWLPQIDQVLVVGMKYGPKGTHEAVKKLRQLSPELSPAQIWHRMRHLREKDRGKRTGPIDWSEDAIETLREGYRSGGGKRRRQSRQSEHFIRDCRDTSSPDSPGVKVGWKENGEPRKP